VDQTSDDRIEVHQTADSAFSYVIEENSGTRIGSDHIRAGRSKIVVPKVSIDDILVKLDLKGVDVVKIDVEGYEYKVLRGMKKLLKSPGRRPRIMMIEVNSDHLEYYSSNVGKIIEYLDQFGYIARKLASSQKLVSFGNVKKRISKNVFFLQK
jgi:hypothetical protein